MSFLIQLLTWINIPMNALGKVILSPIGNMPGWLSNTLIAILTGIPLLVIYKYTSNQRAIGRTRDNIKANMLALKLYKDSLRVTFQAQGRVFGGSLLLLVHSIIPMMVMIVPVCLLLGQMGLWYQFRPLLPGEQAIVTLKLNQPANSTWPDVQFEVISGASVVVGPCRVNKEKQEIWWKIQASEKGQHQLLFNVNGQQFRKELAIGDGFMRLSAKRPGCVFINYK